MMLRHKGPEGIPKGKFHFKKFHPKGEKSISIREGHVTFPKGAKFHSIRETP